jgi:hypothetical protein
MRFMMTGLAMCQFSQWLTTQWIGMTRLRKTMMQSFFCVGSTHGFSYEFTDPDPGGPFYSVSNYVPAEHAHKVDAWVQSETAAGRYMPLDQQYARGTAAIGVVDKYHSNFAKVRVVHHDLSRPDGLSTNDGIGIPRSLLLTVGDAFALLQPGGSDRSLSIRTGAHRSMR